MRPFFLPSHVWRTRSTRCSASTGLGQRRGHVGWSPAILALELHGEGHGCVLDLFAGPPDLVVRDFGLCRRDDAGSPQAGHFAGADDAEPGEAVQLRLLPVLELLEPVQRGIAKEPVRLFALGDFGVVFRPAVLQPAALDRHGLFEVRTPYVGLFEARDPLCAAPGHLHVDAHPVLRRLDDIRVWRRSLPAGSGGEGVQCVRRCSVQLVAVLYHSDNLGIGRFGASALVLADSAYSSTRGRLLTSASGL